MAASEAGGAPRAGEVGLEDVVERRVDVGAVELNVASLGEGPLVVLLHGFPENWWCWRHQLAPLAAAGMRVVAPDLRGYGASDRPRGVGAYRIAQLVDDVAGLIRAEGVAQAAVVGHDWGGALAWELAMRHPGCVERLAILNAPHPLSMARALRTWRQLKKSSYMFAFQLPLLPERRLRAGDFAQLRAMWRRDPVRAQAFSPEDVERLLAGLRPPGALTAALNWYRAAFRRDSIGLGRRLRPVEVPVRVIWGERDSYLGPWLAEPPPELAPRAEVLRIPDASHWVQADAPGRVSALLLEFLLDAG